MMSTDQPTSAPVTPTPQQQTPLTFRQMVDSAIRFWEPCRLIYNGVLGVVAIGTFAVAWVTGAISLGHFPGLILPVFVLAVIANALYCSAYVVDLFVQCSSYRALWLKLRWGLFIIGLLFSCALTLGMCTLLLPWTFD